jgi:hypothetical protein
MNKGRKHNPVKRKKKPETTDSILISVSPIQERTQTYNPRNHRWIKRDKKTGVFRAVKKSGEPWHRVEVEANTPVSMVGW